MTEKRISLAELIELAGITMTVERLDDNSGEDGDKWPHRAWKCTLRRDDEKGRLRGVITVPYYTGMALTDDPTASDVLDNLRSSAIDVENATDFEDWANEHDRNPDSRAAERDYQAARDQANALRRLLGEHFGTLLWHTDPE